MSVRPNVQSLELKGGQLTVKGESPAPRFEALHVVVVQQGTRKGGVVKADGVPLKDSLNWTAVLKDVEGVFRECSAIYFQATSQIPQSLEG